MFLRSVPTPALVLGTTGLVPFYLAALAIFLSQDARMAGFLLSVQILYGAIVASFLGAVQWGMAMVNMGSERKRHADPARWNDGGDGQGRYEPAVRQMLYSVAPALIGWSIVLSFQIIPEKTMAIIAITAMSCLYLACYIADRRAARFGLMPEWYIEMRLPLTVAVIFAYFCTAFALL